MFIKISKLLFCSLFLLAAFFPKSAFSAYIEGLDTTDVNGYGLDSAFKVSGNDISGQNILVYSFDVYYFNVNYGYFNYSFDDIKMAPGVPRTSVNKNCLNSCFIIKKDKDSTYSKVQILRKISGNRCLFRYGTNTTPNDRTLEKADYNRSILYKPNNVYLFYWFPAYNYQMAQDTLFWEPPLPNNNHLIGYILYKAKMGAVIDTTAPINSEQWDSLSLPVTTGLINFTNWAYSQYFNIVAVYTEGKSDFLNGWTRITDLPVGTKNYPTVSQKPQKGFEIRKTPAGYTITFPQRSPFPLLFSIADVNGRLVLRYSGINSNPIYWNISRDTFSPGLYIMTASLSDHTVLTQPFLFTK